MKMENEIRGHILFMREDEETGNVYLKVRVFRPHCPQTPGSDDPILEPSHKEKTEHHKKMTEYNRKMDVVKKLHLGGITLLQVEAKE